MSADERMKGPWAVAAYAATGLAMLFILAPILVTLALSVSDSVFVTFPPKGFTLAWYGKVLSDQNFLGSLTTSLQIATAATGITVVLGVPAAYAIVRHPFPGSGICQEIVLSPLIFPVLITGLVLVKFFAGWGMQNAFPNMILAHALVTLPYVVRTVTASLLLADRSLDEAAMTLGYNPLLTFFRVTIPQIAPGLAAGALFAFMVSLDNFPISMWLIDARTVPVPIMLFQSMSRLFDPSIAAMSSVMIVIGTLAVLCLEKLVGLRRAMTM
ncbi:Inner membrane ABC transporter permease protein YdcV [Methylobacterium crusticola]|uniref:Inner membrane ABC transporter permease protein YdcV n=1 Tax=Methylobacterium crusticola TaxID=1697972 RepID=A0ABQ4R9G0_9HYPH|nr:ABC transporter permease [Methylobacterium crusticola]GJD53981.1 Inner membrane ABC transporter permease protein YdcV [Methylobacterium crusticola]